MSTSQKKLKLSAAAGVLAVGAPFLGATAAHAIIAPYAYDGYNSIGIASSDGQYRIGTFFARQAQDGSKGSDGHRVICIQDDKSTPVYLQDGQIMSDQPEIAYLINKYIDAGEDKSIHTSADDLNEHRLDWVQGDSKTDVALTAAALEYIAREQWDSSSEWQQKKADFSSDVPTAYKAMMDRVTALRAEAKAMAKLSAAKAQMDLNKTGDGGTIKGLGVLDGNGKPVADQSFTLTLTGGATFADGKTTMTGKTGSALTDVNYVVPSSVKPGTKMSFTVDYTGSAIGTNQYMLLHSPVDGEQNMITVGKFTPSKLSQADPNQVTPQANEPTVTTKAHESTGVVGSQNADDVIITGLTDYLAANPGATATVTGALNQAAVPANGDCAGVDWASSKKVLDIPATKVTADGTITVGAYTYTAASCYSYAETLTVTDGSGKVLTTVQHELGHKSETTLVTTPPSTPPTTPPTTPPVTTPPVTTPPVTTPPVTTPPVTTPPVTTPPVTTPPVTTPPVTTPPVTTPPVTTPPVTTPPVTTPPVTTPPVTTPPVTTPPVTTPPVTTPPVTTSPTPEAPVPNVATTAKATKAIVGESNLDDVVIGGLTDYLAAHPGAKASVSGTLNIVPATGSDCSNVDWASSKVVSTIAATNVDRDGTVQVGQFKFEQAGCYSYAETLTVVDAQGKVLTTVEHPLGDKAETTFVSDLPGGSTVASAKEANVGDTISDSMDVKNVTSALASHPDGSVTVSGKLLGPVAPNAKGNCDDLDWAKAPTATTFDGVKVTKDGVVTGLGEFKVKAKGCYTYEDVVTMRDAKGAVIGQTVSKAGQPSETVLVKDTPATPPATTPVTQPPATETVTQPPATETVTQPPATQVVTVTDQGSNGGQPDQGSAGQDTHVGVESGGGAARNNTMQLMGAGLTGLGLLGSVAGVGAFFNRRRRND